MKHSLSLSGCSSSFSISIREILISIRLFGVEVAGDKSLEVEADVEAKTEVEADVEAMAEAEADVEAMDEVGSADCRCVFASYTRCGDASLAMSC